MATIYSETTTINQNDIETGSKVSSSSISTTSNTTTTRMRIQLSFELKNLINTRKGFLRKDVTSPYIVITDCNDIIDHDGDDDDDVSYDDMDQVDSGLFIGRTET